MRRFKSKSRKLSNSSHMLSTLLCLCGFLRLQMSIFNKASTGTPPYFSTRLQCWWEICPVQHQRLKCIMYLKDHLMSSQQLKVVETHKAESSAACFSERCLSLARTWMRRGRACFLSDTESSWSPAHSSAPNLLQMKSGKTNKGVHCFTV